MRLRPVMHLDGCHFYVWVGKPWGGGESVLVFTERERDDLGLWSKPATCPRCAALLRGAEPRTAIRRDVDLPESDGSGAMLVTVLGLAAEIDDGEVAEP